MNLEIKREIQLKKEHFILFGPRGTGKSTLLKKEYPKALFIDLLDPNLFRQYQSHPELLLETAAAQPSDATIIVDEIQKVPELLSVVHKLIEEKTGQQFILTGSSSRKLKRSGVDLMAGRAVVYHLHPFIASELNNAFSLTRALQYGLVPLIVESNNIEKTLDSYIGLYLREEVQAEGYVRNIGHFARFLEVMSFSHGAIVNLTNIARETQVARKLVEAYVEIVEDLLLGFRVPVFQKRAKRATTVQPKFYYFDVGIYKNLRLSGPLDSEAEINGPALEGLIAQHLRAWHDYCGGNNKLYYWRTRSGYEVDFISYGRQGFWAIEVKHSQTIHTTDLRALKAFKEEYPEAQILMVYRGKQRLKQQGVLCIPVEEFLHALTVKNSRLNLS